MKKTIKFFTLILGLGALMMSCNSSDLPGFKKTESGLYYKFETENKSGVQPKVGDILVAEAEIKLNDSLLRSTIGNPQELFMIADKNLFPGDLNEGLQMMHVGDKASFAVSADSLAKFMPLPPFEKDKGAKLFFTIKLISIVSKQEVEKKQQAYLAAANKAETDSIANYIAKHNIKVQPTEEGIYIVSVKKGSGVKAETGKKVKVNYVGKFLNGSLFDTSIEKEAKDGGIYTEQRPYQPIEITIGNGEVIPGWEQTLLTMKVGDVVDVVIPSKLAYGEQGRGPIAPFTPLLFRMELVAVE